MEQSKGFLKLWNGLGKTRGGGLLGLFSGADRVDESFFEELEEALILADAGVAASETLLDQLRAAVKAQKIRDRGEAREQLIGSIAALLRPAAPFLPDTAPAVVLVVGVNGVGKTTTIGKLAYHFRQAGRTPMLAAADTFRAAAAEQLDVWAQRSNTPMVRHGEGADPSAVLFDAAASFRAKGCDLLICDTAGRLHNKTNLMNELSKMRRVLQRELPDMPLETLLVLDATTGQNAVFQAKAFLEATEVTGLVLTKLDGTAKGGVVLSIAETLGIPVRFVGVGEGIDDLQPFDPDCFARALLTDEL